MLFVCFAMHVYQIRWKKYWRLSYEVQWSTRDCSCPIQPYEEAMMIKVSIFFRIAFTCCRKDYGQMTPFPSWLRGEKRSRSTANNVMPRLGALGARIVQARLCSHRRSPRSCTIIAKSSRDRRVG